MTTDKVKKSMDSTANCRKRQTFSQNNAFMLFDILMSSPHFPVADQRRTLVVMATDALYAYSNYPYLKADVIYIFKALSK